MNDEDLGSIFVVSLASVKREGKEKGNFCVLVPASFQDPPFTIVLPRLSTLSI